MNDSALGSGEGHNSWKSWKFGSTASWISCPICNQFGTYFLEVFHIHKKTVHLFLNTKFQNCMTQKGGNYWVKYHREHNLMVDKGRSLENEGSVVVHLAGEF